MEAKAKAYYGRAEPSDVHDEHMWGPFSMFTQEKAPWDNPED